MGIEGLAIFPTCIVGLALLVLIVSGLRNIRRTFKAVLFSFVLFVCTTIVLFAIVFAFEFLGLAFIGELFYLVAVGFVIFTGLRFGRVKFHFVTRELVLQAIIAVFGCIAFALCFLGLTVRI